MKPIILEDYSGPSGSNTAELIDKVLEIQASLIATRDTAVAEQGFLISAFSKKELAHLIDEGGRITIARLDGKIVGYCLITSITEFTHLFKDPASECDPDHFFPKEKIDYSQYDYLYQIGAEKSLREFRIGSQLLAYVKEHAPKGFLTDVLTDPVENTISLRFFRRHGFQDVGVLELAGYRTFGKLKSQVMTWKRENI